MGDYAVSLIMTVITVITYFVLRDQTQTPIEVRELMWVAVLIILFWGYGYLSHLNTVWENRYWQVRQKLDKYQYDRYYLD